MDIEVQLPSSEWICVPSHDPDPSQALLSGWLIGGREHCRATRPSIASQQVRHYWMSRSGISPTQTTGVHIDTFC
jgi:hypothetical protein